MAGCGGSGDRGAVTQTVKDYLAALARGDGTTACAQLTGHEARLLLALITADDPETNPTSCTDAVAKIAGDLGGNEAALLRDAKITAITISGDKATVILAGATASPRLIKTNGHWYIDGGLA